jgi:hypothetical protein
MATMRLRLRKFGWWGKPVTVQLTIRHDPDPYEAGRQIVEAIKWYGDHGTGRI